ncbi:hypothetical protein [Robiginitalea biformata]|uniref:Uncharacterized protein n=1 Tax=Robiginitalea biformata (strain ATCC BAA-864 / DSM 15991 / KCTC 12146 / HTCC2501) TaxID=313596 RepID=A4CKM7_ROBBH|nr:hypothetical protein [Robiginitalea biformata]EAR15426.1 hypothetical protein RB2501_13899 [Robiginitalea biformata HTCC2501]
MSNLLELKDMQEIMDGELLDANRHFNYAKDGLQTLLLAIQKIAAYSDKSRDDAESAHEEVKSDAISVLDHLENGIQFLSEARKSLSCCEEYAGATTDFELLPHLDNMRTQMALEAISENLHRIPIEDLEALAEKYQVIA